MASEAEMFHEGGRFISPTHTPPCTPVSSSQTQTIDSRHTWAERKCHTCSCCKTHANAPTCMAVEMLERERPSRSDSRLEETAEGWEFTGAGETKKKTERKTLNA